MYELFLWITKKGIANTYALQTTLDELNRKPNKISAKEGSKFYKRPMTSWLQDNDIEMYSTHNEGKSVVTERFIRNLMNKIYEYMTSASKNVYTDKIDDIVNKYNNTYYRTIKMKPVDVKSSICMTLV